MKTKILSINQHRMKLKCSGVTDHADAELYLLTQEVINKEQDYDGKVQKSPLQHPKTVAEIGHQKRINQLGNSLNNFLLLQTLDFICRIFCLHSVNFQNEELKYCKILIMSKYE